MIKSADPDFFVSMKSSTPVFDLGGGAAILPMSRLVH
jgi:hypothetical protein